MFSCVHAVREAFKWLTGDNALACEHWRQWIQLMLTLLEHECNNGWDTRGMAWFSYLECRTARFKKQWRRRHWPLIIHAHWLRTLLLAFAVNMLSSCSAHMIRGAYGAQWPVLATGCLLLKLTGVLPACFQVNQARKPFYGMISYEHRNADFDSDGDFNCFMSDTSKTALSAIPMKTLVHRARNIRLCGRHRFSAFNRFAISCWNRALISLTSIFTDSQYENTSSYWSAHQIQQHSNYAYKWEHMNENVNQSLSGEPAYQSN